MLGFLVLVHIFTKLQLPVKNWYDLNEEKTIADAILERIISSAIRFEHKVESMKKKLRTTKKKLSKTNCNFKMF